MKLARTWDGRQDSRSFMFICLDKCNNQLRVYYSRLTGWVKVFVATSEEHITKQEARQFLSASIKREY